MRRRFLLDLTYPEIATVLCEHFGMTPASVDVDSEEATEAVARMRRLGNNPRAGVIIGAAQDMAEVLDIIDKEHYDVWLVTYALAVVNLLEDMGLVEIHE